MSQAISRKYSFLSDYNAGNAIDDRKVDAELDQLVTALNKKVLIASSAPSSPEDGQTWIDISADPPVLKIYDATNSTWKQAILLPASSAQGDIYYYDGSTVARLAAGTAGYFLKTQGAGKNPTWAATAEAPPHYRIGLNCKQASTSTITVEGGVVAHGDTKIEKTSDTTLNLATDSDWIGGTSLRATDTYGYIYVDSSGNIKMHTTAPSKSDTSGNTSGTLRYAVISTVYYRCIGWFYMNSTGSGELDTNGVSNFKDGDTHNILQATGTSDISTSSTTYVDMDDMEIKFISNGRPVRIIFNATLQYDHESWVAIVVDGTTKMKTMHGLGTANNTPHPCIYVEALSAGTHTIKIQWKQSTTGVTYQYGTTKDSPRVLIVEEL